VLLLANGGCSTSYFDRFGQHLASAGLRIVAINMRGVGSSQGPLEGITLHDLAADVAGVIEALEGRRNRAASGSESRVLTRPAR
jgi:pimeloyl-ACP methyl ester carboxylesterase